MGNWKWLQDLIANLPEKSKVRRNLIEIAGYPSWENVNSNLLAFYFDKNEEHGFGTLFIDSLLTLIPNSELISSECEFDVEREVYTNNGNKIDIVISQKNEIDDIGGGSNSDWAIIIENKINHNLNGNDLKDYWNSICVSIKVGIILSKYETDFSKEHQESLQNDGITYYHISHKNLIEKVQEKMYSSFIEADDRHLLFLKEFIVNTINFYNSEILMKENEKILKEFHTNRENIIALKKQDSKMLKFVTDCIIEEFSENNFRAYSTKLAHGKHFISNELSLCDPKVFRFYVEIAPLRYENKIKFVFELYKKQNTRYGTQIKEILKSKNIFSNHIKLGSGGSDKSDYNHIYYAYFMLPDFTEIGLKEVISQVMNEYFWKHPNNFIAEAQSAFNSVLNLS